MNCILRKWRLSDAKDLAAMLNNKKILNNLRDGLPYPYTEQDARDYAQQVFMVNSSPYAVEIYRHLGFVPTDDEQSVDGLRFTPMQYSPKHDKTDGNNESEERNI